MPQIVDEILISLFSENALVSIPIASILAGIIVGIIVWREADSEKWSKSLLYCSLVTAATIMFLIHVRPLLPEQEGRNFSEEKALEIERKIRYWADLPGWEIERRPSDEKLYFHFHVTLGNTTMSIYLPKDVKFIVSKTRINTLNFKDLPKDKQEKIKRRLSLRLIDIGADFDTGTLPEYIEISDAIPYSDELTHHEFVTHIHTVTRAIETSKLFLSNN